VAWKPKDAVVLEANPDFYRGAPKVKRLIVRHIPEPAAQRLLLEKGDIDIARDLTADQVKTVRVNKDLTVSTVEKTNIYYLGLNTKNEILAKPKVWEAMRWLIDYQAMGTTFLDGYFGVHQSFLTGELGLKDKPYHLDVDKAKALLAEAGYPDGFSIDLDVANTDPYPDIGLSLQSTFAKAGIKVKLAQSDMAQMLTKYRARNHQVVLGIWSPDYIDPHSTTDFFVRNTDNSDSATNKTAAWRNAWDIPQLSVVTEQAMTEKDETKRKQTYIEQQKAVQQNSPIIVMFQLTENTLMRKNVSGFVSGPSFDTAVYWTIQKGKE
jgi:peptide/nickel transport system substrate-binding protein